MHVIRAKTTPLSHFLWPLRCRETNFYERSQPFSHLRPQIRREYPLNLSISLSGGKETN